MDFMTGLKRTDYCGDLRIGDVGREVVVAGWVQRQRDLGALIFIDLRDRTGIVQLAFGENTDKEIFDKAFSARSEFVLMAKGVVRERSSKNTEIPTGEIEVDVTDLRVLGKSETPPFEIVENCQTSELTRLKYRYLDLRRPDLQRNIIMRHKICKITRDYFDENGFIEIETPILIRSTPEGARDFLVPSRIHNGSFYALPQSPQLYKQLSMVAGFDRYMQIARCFRDEDLRADRQPEFTQIDLEMSFVTEDDVIAVNEGFLKKLFSEFLGIELSLPLQRMPWKEAMERFGSDKPDLRFGMELCDLSDVLRGCSFRVFADTLAKGGSVRAVKAEGAAKRFSRKEIDALTEFVKSYRAKGLAWWKSADGEASSSFAKFLSEEEMQAVVARLALKDGDICFLVADKNKVVFDALGALRCELARRLDLCDPNEYKLLWVTEFPLYEYDEEENRYYAMHHPFTAPMDEDLPYMDTDPARVRAKAYDIVINGYEAGGGSIRIHSPEIQNKMFEVLGMSEAERTEKFLLNAFRYGVPPHGGMAFGLDRLVMLLLKTDDIRNVIAFPKVQNASELMSGAPSLPDQNALQELNIAVTKTEEETAAD